MVTGLVYQNFPENFISQFNFNFERVFCIWYDTEICCLTMKRILEPAIYRLWKRCWEKVTKKAEQKKEKVLYWSSSTVYSDYLNFKVYLQRNNLSESPNSLSIINRKLHWCISSSNICIALSACSILCSHWHH